MKNLVKVVVLAAAFSSASVAMADPFSDSIQAVQNILTGLQGSVDSLTNSGTYSGASTDSAKSSTDFGSVTDSTKGLSDSAKSLGTSSLGTGLTAAASPALAPLSAVSSAP
ncbi:MAG: hypothetical protein WDW19_03700 [Neisseriaceae bacterium]